MLIVMKFGGTSVGSAERIAQAADLAIASATKGHQVVTVTSAMSGVTNLLIDAASNAARGQWTTDVRQQLFGRHETVAEAIIPDAARRAAALEEIDRRLDRFEKLCYGLSMVHELTPRLLDAISGTGEMLAAPLVSTTSRTESRALCSLIPMPCVYATDAGSNHQLSGASPAKSARKRRATADGVQRSVTKRRDRSPSSRR